MFLESLGRFFLNWPVSCFQKWQISSIQETKKCRAEMHCPFLSYFAAVDDSLCSVFYCRGTYCMEHGAKVAADCVPCPGGYYCPELGTVTPRTCGAGNFSVSSSSFILASVQPKDSILAERGAAGYTPKGGTGTSPSPCIMSLLIWDDCVWCFKQYCPPVLSLQVMRESASLEKPLGMFLHGQAWSCSRHDAKSASRVRCCSCCYSCS